MALPPETSDAFLREVDEELRRDQMIGLWRRWGIAIVGIVLVALAAFGGWLYWQHRQAEAAGAEGERFSRALEALGAEKPAEAQPILAELAKSDRPGYRASALFTEADILLTKDDLKGAAAKFAQVAKDEGVAKPFRDLALIRQTSAEYDMLAPQAVIDRLRGLAVKDSPWFGTAGEMVAVAYLRLNQPGPAGKLFGQIAQAERVPATIRQRAVQMAGVLGVDAIDQTPAASKAAAAQGEEKNTQ